MLDHANETGISEMCVKYDTTGYTRFKNQITECGQTLIQY